MQVGQAVFRAHIPRRLIVMVPLKNRWRLVQHKRLLALFVLHLVGLGTLGFETVGLQVTVFVHVFACAFFKGHMPIVLWPMRLEIL